MAVQLLLTIELPYTLPQHNPHHCHDQLSLLKQVQQPLQ